MKAMVLAAGLGTRLYPLTANRPKPVVQVAGEPLLKHICTLLRESGINDVIINSHHEGDVLREYLSDMDLGMNIQVSEEEDLLGTAGGVKYAEDFFGNTFIVVYGDNLFDVNIAEILEFHRQKNALVTVALTRVAHPEECGVVTVSEDGLITGFVEKPKPGEAPSNLVNAGLYILEREVLDLIPADVPYDFGRELFPVLLRSRGRVYGYVIHGYAKDIGTPRNYAEVHRDILEGKVGRLARPSGDNQPRSAASSAGSHIDPSAVLESPVILGEDTEIAAGARIGSGTVLGRGCRIGQNASVDKSIIWDRVVIGDGASITESVVAEDCQIQERATVAAGCIIGSGCLLEKDSILEPGVKLPPNTVVEEGEIVLHWY